MLVTEIYKQYKYQEYNFDKFKTREIRRQGENFSTKLTTCVNLGTSGRWIGTRAGADVTATLV